MSETQNQDPQRDARDGQRDAGEDGRGGMRAIVVLPLILFAGLAIVFGFSLKSADPTKLEKPTPIPSRVPVCSTKGADAVVLISASHWSCCVLRSSDTLQLRRNPTPRQKVADTHGLCMILLRFKFVVRQVLLANNFPRHRDDARSGIAALWHVRGEHPGARRALVHSTGR